MRGKPIAFAAILVLVLWAVVELVCSAGLRYLAEEKGLEYAPEAWAGLRFKHGRNIRALLAGAGTYVVHDPELGWTLQADAESERGGSLVYRTSSQALRADRDYPPEPRPGTVRIAACGDSFTHGSDVAFADTWAEQLEAIDQRLEVLNFGVIGYGTDQAWLRCRRMAGGFHPHVVVLGIMSDNPLRNVNTFRPFLFPRSGLPFAKPRFELAGGRLRLLTNPLPRLDDYRELLGEEADAVLRRIGRHDFFYRRDNARAPLDVLPSMRLVHVTSRARRVPAVGADGAYDPAGEPARVTAAIAEAFADEALETGRLPVALMLPEGYDLRAARRGDPARYSSVAAEIAGRGVPVVDALDGFAERAPEVPVRRLVRRHYRVEGNRVVAAHLAEWLARRGLTDPEAVRAAAREVEQEMAAAGRGEAR